MPFHPNYDGHIRRDLATGIAISIRKHPPFTGRLVLDPAVIKFETIVDNFAMSRQTLSAAMATPMTASTARQHYVLDAYMRKRFGIPLTLRQRLFAALSRFF